MYGGNKIIKKEELEDGMVSITVDYNGAEVVYTVFPEEILE